MGGSEKSRFVGDEMKMQTWRQTESPQVLEVTIIGSHTESQAPGEVHYRLVNEFLWQLFADGLQGEFKLVNRLRLWQAELTFIPI